MIREKRNQIHKLVSEVSCICARQDLKVQCMKSLKQVKDEHIELVLRMNDWNVDKACLILGIGRSTLFEKAKKLQK